MKLIKTDSECHLRFRVRSWSYPVSVWNCDRCVDAGWRCWCATWMSVTTFFSIRLRWYIECDLVEMFQITCCVQSVPPPPPPRPLQHNSVSSWLSCSSRWNVESYSYLCRLHALFVAVGIYLTTTRRRSFLDVDFGLRANLFFVLVIFQSWITWRYFSKRFGPDSLHLVTLTDCITKRRILSYRMKISSYDVESHTCVHISLLPDTYAPPDTRPHMIQREDVLLVF